MDCIVHRVAKSRTGPSDFHFTRDKGRELGVCYSFPSVFGWGKVGATSVSSGAGVCRCWLMEVLRWAGRD